MEMIKLLDISKSIKDGDWIESKDQSNKGIRLIQTGNIGIRKYLNKTSKSKYISVDKFEELNCSSVFEGDILISRLPSPVGRACIVPKLEDRAITAVDCTILKLNNEICLPKYFLYYTSTHLYLNQIDKFLVGTTRLRISRKNLETIKIPIISIDRQQKFIDVLDKAQSLIDKRKEQIEACDELVKSLFYEMFGDPILNNNKWDIVKVIDVCECMVPGRDKPKSFTGEIPWITIDDLIVSGLTLKSKKEMGLTREEVSEVKRKTIPVGSVIMSCVGNLGITSVAGIEMVINQQLHSFQCGEKINNHFLAYVLPYYKSNMEKVATSTTVLYMNKTACNNIEIILPPLSLQNKFAAQVEKIEQQKNLLEQSLKELENNFNSLMQRAFKGELF